MKREKLYQTKFKFLDKRIATINPITFTYVDGTRKTYAVKLNGKPIAEFDTYDEAYECVKKLKEDEP